MISLIPPASAHRGSGIRYRPEIDGLRAIAVIPVILFHAGFNLFSGGYIGVDVFFVISGYLITTIIHVNKENRTFSIISFYERRARRIFPALFFVVLACIPFAWLWMLPYEFKDFSESIVSIALFTSNFLFWHKNAYFEAPTALNPLIHTWSLAVEEQFYLIFPFLMIFLHKFNKFILIMALTLIAACSLGLAHWASHTHPSANFYLLSTRAWELGIGAILAVITGNRTSSSPGWIAQIGSATGLCAILCAVFAFNATVPFPSLWGLVPVLGTALVIVYATPSTIVGRLLSWPPVVGIGLISYSTYLWHQPLFAFARIRLVGHVPNIIYIALCVLSAALGYLSWRFVERPYRQAALVSRSQIFLAASIMAVSLSAFGLAGYLTAGFPSRHGKDALVASDVLSANYGLSPTCEDSFTLSTDCRTNDSPQVLVWGDSFAMHLVDGIIASNPDVSLIQMTKSVCGPFLGIAPISNANREYDETWSDGCMNFNNHVFNWVNENHTVKFAVLSSAFSQYVDIGSKILYHDHVIYEPEMTFIAQQFEDTLSWLAGKGITPIVFAPPPSDGEDTGNCLVRNKWLGLDSTTCVISLEKYQAKQNRVIAFLKIIQKYSTVIWPYTFLCKDDYCDSQVGDILIYRDSGHLSHEGSRYLGASMDFDRLIRGQH